MPTTSRRFTRTLLIAATALLAQCMDTDSLAPLDEGAVAQPPAYNASLVTCTGSTRSAVIQCSSVAPGSPRVLGSRLVSASNAFGSSSLVLPPGGIIVGGQHTFVTLASSNITDDGSIFGFDVTVENLIPQAMGTFDGATPALEGVRVFFHELPTVTGATPGTISIRNEDGFETFMTAGQPYYQYDGILDPQETSATKTWQFDYTGGDITFVFKVYVWAPVQYPDGWVIVTPSSQQLEIPSNTAVQLTGDVVDAVGRSVTAPPAIVWASTDEAVATVDNTGLVTAVGPGMATITATADTYEGSAEITVIGALDHFDVEASGGGVIGEQASGAAFDIRITAKDAADQTITDFTGTVDLTSTPADLSVTSSAFTAGVLATQNVTIGAGGNYTITATRTGGTEAGTSNSFDVTADASAVADEASGTSVPNDPYHTPLNTALSIPDGAQDLLANDTRGFPLANVSHFGAAQCNNGSGTQVLATDAIDANAAGSTQNLTGVGGCTGGSLTVNADGTLTFTPTATYTGLFRFQYRITNSAGTSDAQVTLAVGVRPSATNSTYTPVLAGNVPINTATSTNTLVDAAGDQLSFSVTGNSNGTGTIASNKTYSFAPALGHSGAAGFTFTATNGFGASTPATVSLTVGTPVWFVDAAAGGGGTGTPASPFNCLAGTNCFDDSANEAGDIIYVTSGSYASAASLVLKASQRVIGAASTADFATTSGLTWPADAGAPPLHNQAAVSMSSTAGSVITLSTNNTLRGIALGNAQAGSQTLSGTSFGTLTVANDVSISANTEALSITNGTIAGDFGSISSSGGANNIWLDGVAGTSNLGGGALSGAATNAIMVNGSTGTFTYGGTITSAGRPASITNKTGGAVTLSGNITGTGNGILVQGNSAGTAIAFSGTSKSLSTGTNNAVTLLNNAGSTIGFTNGGLALTTSTGTAFSATGGGTVTVEGSGNTISLTGAVTSGGLLLDGITVGTGDITFASVGSAATTVASPVFTQNVTGGADQTITIGTVTIAGTNNPDANVPPGIFLISTSAPVTIGSATIDNTEGAGIFVQNSSGAMTFTTVDIDNTGAAGIQLTGNTGAVAVNGGTIGASNDPTGNAVDVEGGNADVTIVSPLIKATAGRIAEVTGHTGGTVSFQGGLTCNTACTGINVASNTGGTIEFSNASKVISTGASQAITLTNNAGATVTFSNGGLAATTTSGTVFGATGGGTINVSGSNNTLTTETDGSPAGGTILSANGVSGALTFKSLSGHGASTTATGILLNATTGMSLSVTGDGTANSGGIIQNYTQRGAHLVNANNITLTRMWFNGNGTANLTAAGTCGDGLNGTNTNCAANIDMQTVNTVTINNSKVSGSAQIGINGKNVTNLTLTTVEVNNNGNEALEDGIQIHNLFGTAVWANVNAYNNASRHLEIQNSSSTALNLTVNTSQFYHTSWPGSTMSAQGVLFSGTNGANMTMSLQNSSIRRNFGPAFQTDIAGTGTSTNVTLNNDTIIDNGQSFVGATTGSGNITYVLSNSIMTVDPAHTGVTAISIAHGGSSSGTITGTISDNTIGDAAIAKSGAACDGCNAISVRNNGSSGIHKVTISGNTIQRSGGGGINITAGNNTVSDVSQMKVHIYNNTITKPDNTQGSIALPLTVVNGTVAGDLTQTCADISGNSIVNAGGIGAWNMTAAIRLRHPVNNSVYRLRNYTGGATDDAAVNTYLAGRNTLNGGTAAVSRGAGPGTWGNTSPANSACF